LDTGVGSASRSSAAVCLPPPSRARGTPQRLSPAEGSTKNLPW
jgi:hypothetical protein